jgi:hypothetical protein
VKLGAVRPGRCRGGRQAAPTKPGRVSTARWCGSGKQDGEVYERNRWLKPPKVPSARTWRIWAGSGACSPCAMAGNSRVVVFQTIREATVKCCGVAVAMPRGYSRVPTPTSDQSVNTGTSPALPAPDASSAGEPGWAHRLSTRLWEGRSRRSTPSRGEPGTWGRAAARSQGRFCNVRRIRGGCPGRVASARFR